MAISTNGTVIARVAGALYNTQLSNATYAEVAGIVTTSASLNALINDLYARDFATTADLKVAQTLVGNLGLSEVVGLDNWVAAQITAAGAANKGAKIVELLNSFAQMSSDATYGTAAAAFNTKTDAALSLSQTVGNTGGTFAAAGSVATAGATFTLTTGLDAFTGGAGNDSFVATTSGTAASNTLSTADVINGGAGTDTLYLALGAAFAPVSGRISNVENLVLQSPGYGFDVAPVSGLTSIDVQNPSAAVSITNISGPGVALSVSNASSTSTATFTVKGSSLTGAADAASVTVSGVTNTVLVKSDSATNVFESVNITSSGVASGTADTGIAINVQDSASANTITSMTVAGDANLYLSAVPATVKTISASAMTGGLSVSSADVVNATVTGGAGNDVFTGGTGNDVIVAGAGADTITAGAGNDSVDAGAGNDTVVASSVTYQDTLSGGDGTDTLSLASAVAYSSTATNGNAGANITGFEALTVTAALTQDFLGLAGNTITTLTNGAVATVLRNATAIDTINLKTNGSPTVTMTRAVDGTADAVSVVMTSATAAVTGTLSANQIETINVSSAGTAGNSLTMGTSTAGTELVAAAAATATSLTTVNITGSKSFTFTNGTAGTALKTVNAADFTGAALTVVGTGSTAAMTITGTGAYEAHLTGGTGADTILGGSGNDTIVGATGNNSMTGGSGNDSISGSTGNDYASGGDGNDTLVGSSGNNTLVGGAGDDTISSTTGADSIDGGDGADSIVSSSGSDYITAGAGNDTIDAGSGDDTVLGGEGNDQITVLTLTNGDSIDGGAGTADKLIVTSISSSAKPTSIANVENLTISAIGGSTATTLDLENVSGFTSFTATETQTGNTALTFDNIASTVTGITIVESAAAYTVNTDDFAFNFLTAPTATTVTLDSVVSDTVAFTQAGGITLHARLNTGSDADLTARTYTNGTNNVVLGAVTTDGSSLSLTVDALPAAVAGVELTTGALTANNATSVSVVGATNSDVTVTTIGASNVDLTSVTITAGANATTTHGAGTFAATGATALSYTSGNSGTLTNGGDHLTFASTTGLTVTENFGDSSVISGSGDIVAKVITSASVTVGAGVTATLPSLEVTAAATANTIGATSFSIGAASVITQGLGSTTTPYSIGAVTVTGSGKLILSLGNTIAATTTASTVNAQGAISASGMTAAGQLFLGGSSATSKLVITGSAGADSLVGGGANDTITGGVGSDTLTGGSGSDVFIYSVGDSNAVVATGANGDDAGADTITALASGDLIRVNITSADTTWDFDTHVKVGTAGGSVTTASNTGNAAAYATTNLLIQTGAVANTDSYDIVIDTTETDPTAYVSVYLTGTVGADTLIGGANADSIIGGTGDDSITGAGGSDTIDGGAGNDVFVLNENSGSAITLGDGSTIAAATAVSGTTTYDIANADFIQNFGTGDILRFTTVHAMSLNTAGVLVDNKATMIKGSYVASTGIFTYDTSSSGTSTLVIYDTNASTSAVSFKGVVLVGYVDGTTADAFTTTGTTGLVASA